MSDSARHNMSISQKARHERYPELSKQNSDRMKKLWQTDAYRTKTIRAQKAGWTKEARERWSKKNIGKKLSSTTKQKIRDSVTQAYRNPEVHKKISEKVRKAQTPEYWKKRHETLKKNHTFNSSSVEEKLYEELCKKYGQRNIERQYKDTERYPYYCDFYIISEDIFVELNYHWTHGGCKFDINDIKCQKQLAKWKEKAVSSDFYKIAIEVWTRRDVEKYKSAVNNHLKYITLYNDSDIAHFLSLNME